MAPSDLVLRTFRREDLPGLLELYNRAPAEAPHFIRDNSFLEYFVQCHGAEDGVFAVLEADKAAGLAVVSITEEENFRQGRVIELQAKDATAMTALIQAVENYCDKKDVDMIAVVPPPYINVGDTFKGWLKFETGAMQCKSLNIKPLLKALLDREELRNTFARKKFSFHIGDEEIGVKVNPQSLEIVKLDSAVDGSNISLAMSPQVFLELTLRGMNPYKAFLMRKIKVQNPKDIPAVLKMLQMIKLKQPWSLMLGDRM